MKKLTLLFMLLASPVFADESQSQAGDRIALQIGRLVIQLENKQDELNKVRAELDKASNRIKELEAKEPK